MPDLDLELYQGCYASSTAAYQALGRYLLQAAQYHLATYPHLLADAEDCVQEALINIYQALQSGRGPNQPAKFRSWCTAIVIFRVKDLKRKPGNRNPLISLDQPTDGADNALFESIVDDKTSDPGTVIPGAQMLVDFLLQIRDHPALSTSERTVIWEGYMNGVTTAQLAEQLGKTPNAITLLRKHGLDKLRNDKALMAQLQEIRQRMGE